MPNKKLNILFLSSWYPSKAITTLGNFVQRHAEAVATLHHVHVLYVAGIENLQGSFYIEEEEIREVKTTIVYCKPGFINKYKAFKKGIRHLQAKQEFHFDLVHHNVIWPSGWQAYWLKKKFKIPYIITEHWTGYDPSIRTDQPFFLRIFSKLITSNASCICPVTQNLAEVMQKYGIKGNYEVVPNVVDTSIFHLEKKVDHTTRFLHVSTLNDQHKNILGILRVWKIVSDESQDIHLQIGGDGPFQNWENLAHEMEIRADSIAFFGEKKSQEIAQMMQFNDCLLMFSNYENLPCVIVEALASGMAVISTDVGGIKEHIDSTRGILILKGNEIELANAIRTFVKTKNNYDPPELSAYAKTTFGIPNIAKKFDALYRKYAHQA